MKNITKGNKKLRSHKTSYRLITVIQDKLSLNYGHTRQVIA